MTFTNGAKQFMVQEALLRNSHHSVACRTRNIEKPDGKAGKRKRESEPHDIGDLVVVVSFIHTNDIGRDISTFSRSSDDYLLGTGLDVIPSNTPVNKHSSPLHIIRSAATHGQENDQLI